MAVGVAAADLFWGIGRVASVATVNDSHDGLVGINLKYFDRIDLNTWTAIPARSG